MDPMEQREDAMGVPGSAGHIHTHSNSGAYCTHRDTLKAAGNPRLFMLSSWLWPAVIFLHTGAMSWTLHCGCAHGDCSAWCIWISERGQKRSIMDRLPVKII